MRTIALETAINIYGAITLLYGLWAFLVPRLIARKNLQRKKWLINKRRTWAVLYLAIQTNTNTALIEKWIEEYRASRRKKPTAWAEPPQPSAREN